MARHYEPTEEQLREWSEWLSSRPQIIKDLGARFQPWELYRLKSSGHRVFPRSFSEDGTLTVIVSEKYNAVIFGRQVFGIRPDDLEPCEMPGENEAVGALLSQEDVNDNLDVIRVAVRPDLWAMGEDGKARRKN